MTLKKTVRNTVRQSHRAYRAYLAEDYDGIHQYAMVALSKASTSGALRARVSAGDVGAAIPALKGTPVVVFSYRGQLEILSLGANPTGPTPPVGSIRPYVPEVEEVVACMLDDFDRLFSVSVGENEFLSLDLGTSTSGIPWLGSDDNANGYLDTGASSSAQVVLDGEIFQLTGTSVVSGYVSHGAHIKLAEALADGTIDMTFMIRLGPSNDGNWLILLRLYDQDQVPLAGQIETSLVIDPTGFYIGNVTGGGSTQSDSVSTPFTTDNTWYWVRWERDESSRITRVKVWADGAPEPGSWLMSLDISAAGAWSGHISSPSDPFGDLQLPFFAWQIDLEDEGAIDIAFDKLDAVGICD